MGGTQKLIGVCLTKIHDESRTEYIEALYRMTKEKGYRLMIFNSFEDFDKESEFSVGAAAVFDIINYRLFDAIIIIEDCFCKQSVVDRIIDGALAEKVPVILLNGRREGCYSIIDDFEASLKNVIRHVIIDHRIKDTFFIGGNEENDRFGAERLQCYKEVLEELGIPFSEERVGYSHYWEGPVNGIIDRLTDNGRTPPRAIICVNDYTAFSVCKRLSEHGYLVPDDVIVTGFDGVAFSQFHSPSITTCRKDYFYLAAKTTEMLKELFEGNAACTEILCPFKEVFAESCGCAPECGDDFRDVAAALQVKNDSVKNHENYMFSLMNKICASTDSGSLYNAISECILGGSHVCIQRDYMKAVIDIPKDNNGITGEMIVVSSSRNYKNEIEKHDRFDISEMVPGFYDWVNEESIRNLIVITAIYVGRDAFGIYVVRSSDLLECGHKIHRISETINLGFTTAVSRFKQKLMKISLDNAAYKDHVTDLPNMKGISKWFEEFRAVPQNHSKTLAVSVYAFRKFKFIYENYGIRETEESLCFIAEALKMANSTDCFVGQISEDEFVVINYVENSNDISNTINNAVSVFYGIMGGFNDNGGKEYNIEVNAGCTVVNSGWNEDIESYIKLANNEMYMNRMRVGMTTAEKEKKPAKYDFDMIEMLISTNMFRYHFQPIISTETGEIFAYEALMRTDSSINLSPLEVLEAAEKYGRLYDIERATVFNIMERYLTDTNAFHDRRVFINSIPGYFLNSEDTAALRERYSELMKYFVFEITEQNTISDEELIAIRNIGGDSQIVPIAVDDYGTGHSNIVNLIRYSPEILKIDRFLISDIDTDVNKQMFVKSTIEFARMNNIKVLAEGIETAGELKTVVEYGVDYIQGYYTGRPASQPLDDIPESIREEIMCAKQCVS